MSCELECGEVQGSKPDTGSSCGWKLCGGYWESIVLLEATVTVSVAPHQVWEGRTAEDRRVTRGEF